MEGGFLAYFTVTRHREVKRAAQIQAEALDQASCCPPQISVSQTAPFAPLLATIFTLAKVCGSSDRLELQHWASERALQALQPALHPGVSSCFSRGRWLGPDQRNKAPHLNTLNFINDYKTIKGKKIIKKEEVIWRVFDCKPVCVLK